MRLAGVPEIYWQSEWEQVRAEDVRQVADTLAVRMQSGRGAMILGGPGVGKSSAAGLICLEAARKGLSVRWSYVPTLMDEMLDSKQRLTIVRQQSAVDLLVWDDLGVRALAGWEYGFMDQIVEARYQRRRPMIVTGNLTPDDLRSNESLTRMVDRWRQRTAADLIPIGGRSRRT